VDTAASACLFRIACPPLESSMGAMVPSCNRSAGLAAPRVSGAPGGRGGRGAFTLVEMLIVIAVLAVLASLLIPGVTLVRALANQAKCCNNLQQIAVGITTYKFTNNDILPGCMSLLMTPSGPLPNLQKLLICPLDPSNGADPAMGRGPNPPVYPYSDVYEPNATTTFNGFDVPGGTTIIGYPSSYFYQCSCVPLCPDPSSKTDGYDQWFYTATDLAAYKAANDSQEPTWLLGKHNELVLGAPNGSGGYYGPFSPSQFPILSCFHHEHWTQANITTSEKLISVTWDLNIMKTIVYWEHEVNPAIPLPP
jgi:prepilin-type N-terminal cleavage/methylation domain-containing protein